MCINCDWEKILKRINTLLEKDDYEWAFDTLEGIKEWIEEHEHVTDAQMLAIENIRKGGIHD